MLDFSNLKPLQCLVASFFFRHKKILLMLPRQEGKTELGVRIAEDLTRRPTPSASLFLAKDYKSQKRMAKEKIDRIFDGKKFRINTEGVRLIECPQSYLSLGSVDKDPDRHRGGTWDFILWSEVAFSKLEKEQTILDFYQKVLLLTQRKTQGYFMGESTPNGHNGWKDFWDNAKEFGFRTFKVSLSQMLEMGLISAEEFETAKTSMHPDIFRQECECEFVSFKGHTYPELNDENLWPHMPPPESWQMVISGLDWGYSPSATCVLFAFIKDDIIYVFDEIYSTHQKPSDTRDAIAERLTNYNVPKFQWVGAGDHEQDRNDALIEFGLTVGLADKRSVLGSRMKIKERLWKKTLVIDPIKCPMLVKDLQTAVWDGKKDGEIDYNECSWGHYDAEAALRYLIEECAGMEQDEPIKNPHKTDDASARAWLELQGRRRE